MSRLNTLRKTLSLAAILVGALVVLWPASQAAAQKQGRNATTQQPPDLTYVPRTTGIGGYSMTLRDVWGPAKMPPAPKDFGPHFDYPPQPLNGVPTHTPYPN